MEIGSGFKTSNKPNSTLVVLGFIGSEPLAESVTNGFRKAVGSSNLAPYQGKAFDEMIKADCEGTPTGDGVCIAIIGRGLQAEWVLWGKLLNEHMVEVQLVPTQDPSKRRSLTIELNGGDVKTSTERAWSRLQRL